MNNVHIAAVSLRRALSWPESCGISSCSMSVGMYQVVRSLLQAWLGWCMDSLSEDFNAFGQMRAFALISVSAKAFEIPMRLWDSSDPYAN